MITVSNLYEQLVTLMDNVMITKIAYYTESEAKRAAAEFAEEHNGTINPRLGGLDDKAAGLVESDSFAHKVGQWSGEMNALYVEDDRGQTLGIFGYWVPESEYMRHPRNTPEAEHSTGMTAAEVIKALQQVAPTTRVTVTTADRNGVPVEAVRVMGYTDGVAVIVTEE